MLSTISRRPSTYSEKYHEPTTPAQVARRRPLPTPHVHNHTQMVPTIAQFAHPCTCHTQPDGLSRARPTSRRRNASVTNGNEASNSPSRTAGERARRKGLAIRSRVVSVSREDAVCISRGRSSNRRPVSTESAKGIKANKRRLTYINA